MQKQKDLVHLVWFRNDLRVHDNVVLRAACLHGARVIGVYCLDPAHFADDEFGFIKTGKIRAKFLLETLRDLKLQLAKLNIGFLVLNEKPEKVLSEICIEYGVTSIFLQNEWTQQEVDTEKAVRSSLNDTITWHGFYNQLLYHPDDIPFSVSETPHIFTVFRKKLEKYTAIREEVSISALPASNYIEIDHQIVSLSDLGFDTFSAPSSSAFPFTGGEASAMQRLGEYFFQSKNLGKYKKTRNGLVGLDYSSKFSSWLANGSLSVRTVYWKVKQFEMEQYKNQSTYWLVFELMWRDYFKYVSMKHGNKIFKIGGILEKDYQWSTDDVLVQQWISGTTQSEFVNANMIELKKTGWMSNRGRQNVASYFAKDLQLDWRIGAAYFESQLIDYDVHSNYGNWMYVAGVGNDLRDRKFNVELQAKKYDPGGKFRKLWLQPGHFRR